MVVLALMADGKNELAARLRSVIEEQIVADAETWCEAAGLSRGFLSSFFVRSKTAEDASMRGPSVERLAIAAKVSPAWLLTGKGPREIEAGDGVELGSFDAARAMFLAQEGHDGRADEARTFLAERNVAFAGAERKSPRWWLETLTEEFREWRDRKGETLPKVNPRRVR